MGLLGVLERNIMAGASIAVSVLLFLFFRIPIALSVKTIRYDLTDVWQKCIHHPYLTAGFTVVALLVGLRMLAHIWILSPYIWDTLAYQLPKVADWVQYKELVVVPTVESRSFWPANFELFQTWFVLFFHHDFLIEAAGLPFYLLAIASVYSVARSLYLSRPWSAFSAVLFALIPSVLMNAVSCKNDISIVSVYLFILALLLNYRRNRDHIIEHIVLIIAGFLLAVGTKPTMVFIVPGLFLIGLWCFWGRMAHTVGIVWQKNVFMAAGFVLAASVLLGIYWYTRNYFMFENPFHPTDFRINGHLVFGDGHGQGQQGTFKWNSIVVNFRDLIEKKIFDRSEPYTADLGGMAGWGWFIFSIGLTTSILALRIRSDFRWLAIGFLLSLTSLFGFVTPDSWNMRFASWFPVLFVIGYSIFTSDIKTSVLRWSFLFLAIICSLMNYIACLSTGYTQLQEWKARAGISVWNRTIVHENVASDLSKIPAGEKFGYFTRPNAWIYPLFGPDYSRMISYLKLRRDMDLVSEMNKANFSYLLLFEADKEWIEYMDLKVSQGLMKRLTHHLYRLAETSTK